MKYLYFILLLMALGLSLFFGIRELRKPNNANTISNTTEDRNQNLNLPVNINQPNINTNIPVEVINTNASVNINAGSFTEIRKGNTAKKQVIFTFDAGSGTQSIQAILAALKKNDLTATFFLTGKWAEKNPDWVRSINAAGHEIFNHTYDHPHLSQISDEKIIEELVQAENIISGLTGKTTKPYFRPPYGDRNTHVLEVAGQAGYQSVFWTVDALDWEESTGMTAAQVKARIMEKLAPGDIYLMHVGDNITSQVLDEVIQNIQSQGYKIVSLSQGI